MAKTKAQKLSKENAKDKRTRSSVKSTFNKLLEMLGNSKLAKALGVSPQKLTAIKKDVKAGKIYGPDAKAVLQKELSKATPKAKVKRSDSAADDFGLSRKEFNKQNKKIQAQIKREEKELERLAKETTPEFKRVKRRGQDESGVWYYPSRAALKADVPNFKIASVPFSDYKSAVNWWKGVSGGAGYFAILREKSKKGNDIFFIADIDPGRTRKATSKKVNEYNSQRAKMLEENWRKTTNE